MHHGKELGVFPFRGLSHGVRIGLPAPLPVHPDELGPDSFDDLAHPAAESAVDADDRLIARFEHVDQAGLHAQHTRTGHREGQLILGLENVPEKPLGFIHDSPKNRGPDTPRTGRPWHGGPAAGLHSAPAP